MLFNYVYYYRYFNPKKNSCGKKTLEDSIEKNLSKFDRDRNIILGVTIFGFLLFLSTYILLLIRVVSGMWSIILCVSGVIIMTGGLIWARSNVKKYEDELSERNHEEKKKRVMYSLKKSNVTSKKQVEQLNELLKIELNRCDDDRRAIDSKLFAIISAILSASLTFLMENIPVNAPAGIIVVLLVEGILAIYYLINRDRSRYCMCSIEHVYNSLCDLGLFMGDEQFLGELSKKN